MERDATTHLVIELPAEVGIDEADALKESLISALTSNTRVSLSAAHVRRMGTAGLQVLAAFALKAQQRNESLAWAATSDALLEAAKSCGLRELLGLQGT